MVFSFTDPITRVLFIRHGQTAYNAKGVISGGNTISLNAHGRSQAKAVAKRLYDNFKIEFIYSSPMRRAHETAKPIAELSDLKITLDHDLVEYDYGLFEGKELSWMKQNYPQEYSKLFKWMNAAYEEDLERPDFVGMESMTDLKHRIQRFMKKILEQHFGSNIAVFSHAGFIKFCLLYYLGGDFNRKVPIIVNNGSISIIDFYKGNPALILLNDYQHTQDKVMTGYPKPP
jgi:broad specificity phosphatase PhoE